MLAEVFPDILVCFGIAMTPIYGLCVEAATLGEFNHSVDNCIVIAWFTI